MNYSRFRVLFLALSGLVAASAEAQWLTQNLRLEPGWNAVYLHIDASHRTLDEWLPSASGPVSEVWLWSPSAVTNVSNTRWTQWTATRSDSDTLTRLSGNLAYLVRNSGTTSVVWSVQGKPLPPDYEWTTSGLNFIGFPTPQAAAPRFDQFLAPAPGLDLARSAENLVEIIHYPGGTGAGGVPNPAALAPLVARSVLVTRGKAFWVRAATNYYNRYYGPVEVAFQNPKGVDFRDNLGTHSVRLRNLTATNRTVTLNVVASESAPSGQTAVFATPQLLLRGERSLTNLSYSHTVLDGSRITLAPAGQPGSEREVVLGLNRRAMTGSAGALYAGILRISDSEGLSQIDAPVTASVPALGGLWAGEASVDQVGQYLKTYPRLNAEPPPAPRSSFLTLDGTTNFARLPAGSYTPTGAVTIEGWVFVRRVQNWNRFLDIGNGPANQNIVVGLSHFGSGKPFLDVYRGNSLNGTIIAADPLPLNAWVHLAVIIDPPAPGATVCRARMFYNGSVQADGTINAPLDVVRSNAYLGKSNWPDAFTDAAFDDVRIWSLSRSVSELQRDMVISSYPPNTPGLLLQYEFPTTGDAGGDSSGNGRHLTLVDNAARGAATVGTAATIVARLAQTVTLAGRPIPGSEISGAAWEDRTPGVSRNYSSIASSEDGRVLVAADSDLTGRLYVSTNGGAAWITSGPSGVGSWQAVSVSSSGAVIAAVANNQRIYISRDTGVTWSAVESARAWSGLAMSTDGSKLAAAVLGGKIYVSTNRGDTWVERDSIRNWTAIASSADGDSLVAGVSGGTLYTSKDGGATWTSRESARSWSSVASSADGLSLIASVNAATTGGQLYTSTDGGVSWQVRERSRAWARVASSADGVRLVAVVKGGAVYASTDGGASWTAQDESRSWFSVCSSADGGRLAAVVLGGGIYTRSAEFAEYAIDAESGLVRDKTGAYISSGVNTNLARTASALPLRLILHQDASAVKLLQRVYVGQGAGTTNTILANRESLLDRARIGEARRLSAAHLPFTPENVPWPATGRFQPGAVLTFEVVEDFDQHTSNPFLHTFHPDHDNLTPDFKGVQALGAESYGITRRIQLTVQSPSNDFGSLTATSLALAGQYEETMSLAGRSGSTREFKLAGTFSIQRISPIDTLTIR
jgi:hypothetical protein